MTEPGSEADGSRHYLGLIALAVVVAVAAIVLVNLPNNSSSPFTPPQADPRLVGLRVLTPTDGLASNVKAALDGLGGSATNSIEVPESKHWQYVIGRVDVANQPPTDARYDVIVVDNRLRRVVPQTYSYPEPGQGAQASQGWDRADASLHGEYGWLPSSLDQGASYPVSNTTSVIFWARLPADTNPVTDSHTDLSVVLALKSSSDHVYWSEKIN
ncbi:MAG TPA: hypothetical protein VHV76_02265 [Mycobacteriales bacterium]|jgi:hypothetical protein|nr:hypothetical protein [Mycobacteriales bacterium]